MAVARVEPISYRRYNPHVLRQQPHARRLHLPLRAVVIAIIVVGSVLQHLLATLPAEPQPAPLIVAGSRSMSQVQPATAAPRQVVLALPRSAAPAAVHPWQEQPVAIKPAHRPKRRAAGTSLARLPLSLQAIAHRAVHVLSPLLPPVGAAGDRQRSAMAPNPDGLILHLPSVSVGAIRDALRAADSPVLAAHYADQKDAAEYIWDSGRVLGVDPAVIMGIFRHESVFGTRGIARLTDSVGNLRPVGNQPSLDGYRLYHSWEEGIDACYRLLLTYAHHGAETVDAAIPVWAPSTDNNDDSAYISSVLTTMAQLYASSQ